MKKILVLFLSILFTYTLYAQANEAGSLKDVLDVTYKSNNLYLLSGNLNNLSPDKKQKHFMVEYLCVDKRENKIHRRKLEFPMQAFKKLLTSDKGQVTLSTPIYYCSFEFPIEIYNPDSLKSFEKSQLFDKKRIIQVCVIPGAGDRTNVVINHSVKGLDHPPFQIHIAVKAFTSETKFKWAFSSRAKDNVVIPFLQDNVWKYVDEYILISLED
jgi:hypothetical protein